jgi:hypothetical protein
MVLIGSGIEKVRAFELAVGIWADGGIFGLPRTALVKWSVKPAWSDKFEQIYINGQYAGTTVDSGQRQMIVQMPSSLETPVRIEVFAVEADEADTDFSGELDSFPADTGRVKISVLREQSLPIGSVAQVYFDNGTGEIDYDNPVNDLPIRVWPVWQDKAGFGMSRFGFSDFGFDSAAAVGFGKGCFGYGRFGLDADTFEWISPQMNAGVYKFAVKVVDEAGSESESSETSQITVTPAARPAEQVSVSLFDKQTNHLVLKIG